MLGIYAYAPVRLLWPLAVVLLALAALRNTARRGVLIQSALLCALVGDGEVSDRADGLIRFVESRCPEGCAVERDLLSLRDIRD